MMKLSDRFLESDLPYFEPDGKVGLLATIDEEGLPHITMITAMQAKDPEHLIFGQFCEGKGKENVQVRNKAGFLIMTLNKELWRGKALWTHSSATGPEADLFNQKPMWRYNSYFSMHTVHYMDLIGTTRKEKLPMGKIVSGVVKSRLYRARQPESEVMNPWTQSLISKVGALKFLAYIDSDGFPILIPVLSARTISTEKVLIPLAEYADDIVNVPEGPAALYTMDLTMETVLVRGNFTGVKRHGLIKAAELAVNHVYNSMPPGARTIYPSKKLEPVTEFQA